MKHRNKRQLIGAELRRLTVLKLYRAGWQQSAISTELGVAPSTISKDIANLQKQWREDRVSGYEQWVELRLAELTNAKEAAWEGWKRSCEPEVTYTQETDKDGNVLEKTVTRGQAGDPRFLAQIAECIMKEAKLLGFDEPKSRAAGDQAFGLIKITVESRQQLQEIRSMDQLRPLLIGFHGQSHDQN